jgi:hypothetical protein
MLAGGRELPSLLVVQYKLIQYQKTSKLKFGFTGQERTIDNKYSTDRVSNSWARLTSHKYQHKRDICSGKSKFAGYQHQYSNQPLRL